ncbi:hypothetical protein PTSG_01027 [Salpingoeca rosetta]|uniref:Translation initiation factor eIF2B subunit delta n=1 Tax=Salpingoeca rosetta (strain ATCC 50818 / BSB-021) TaxID=946362 RepID=F2TY66_SALR5|nr:uncharacterized protein PTSG_01027 [Salpingoeca rosetta]EGD76325.1 hypothetical protein PTSG_01027 [Salpingoeca rosetta]|eukprot:XP_004998500.1 hypothetical protein PTSG_01027 [Salpingoeca rosetta]
MDGGASQKQQEEKAKAAAPVGAGGQRESAAAAAKKGKGGDEKPREAKKAQKQEQGGNKGGKKQQKGKQGRKGDGNSGDGGHQGAGKGAAKQKKAGNKHKKAAKKKGPVIKRQVDLFSHLKQPDHAHPLSHHSNREQRKLPEPILEIGVRMAREQVTDPDERCILLLLALKVRLPCSGTTPHTHTHIQSPLITRVLYTAFCEKEIDFRVVVIDSRPYLPGREQVKSLALHGIPCEYTLLSSVSYAMRAATKVFLGAHSMMSNGNLVASAGTAQVANTASFFNVPVIVCCEAYKFSSDMQADSFVHNELGDPDDLLNLRGGFESSLKNWMDIKDIKLLNLARDVTPAKYIDVLVTDYGLVPPFSSTAVLRKSDSKFDQA